MIVAESSVADGMVGAAGGHDVMWSGASVAASFPGDDSAQDVPG